ncbi:MAG: CRTAC1 family protein [Phycisphaerales bacterium]|nr:CRTAC1 family protein [Phycisphaerae bacterium]NNM26828.1 CRTAC1 family protein [Phycisphaerales bacterium]
MSRIDRRWFALFVTLAATVTVTPGCDRTAPDAGQTQGRTEGASIRGGFIDVAADLGIDFAIDRSLSGDYFLPDSMTAGCALFDYDNDGDLDLYIVNAFRNGKGESTTPEGANRLYRQEADGQMVDVTDAAGVGDRGFGQGVTTGDIDNDGDLDLYVANYEADVLYRNEGNGTFTDVSTAAGIANDQWAVSAGFGDLDGDGYLDLYVCNYLALDESVKQFDPAGRPEYPGPSIFDGTLDVLYRNNGDGTFSDVSEPAGVAVRPGKGLGVVFGDLDGDDAIDIYVANDGEPNFAWIQTGPMQFEDRALTMGLAVNTFGRPEASMGIGYGDVDADGDFDLFIGHLVRETNTLYRQVAPGVYQDDTIPAGLAPGSLDFTAFGAAFLDVELDGDLDVVVGNGRVVRKLARADAIGLNPHWTPYAEPNQLLLNDGTGRFADADAATAGDLARHVEVSRGLCVGDLDGDGDLDVVISNSNGSIRVYRNEFARAGHWLAVRAVDPALGRDALGAVIEVGAGERRFRRIVRTAHSYASASPPETHFGLGAVTTLDELIVEWPDGLVESFEGGPVDVRRTVERGAGTIVRTRNIRSAYGGGGRGASPGRP